MNLSEVITLISFVGSFGILALKFYNITTWGKWYKPPIVFITFSTYLVLWLLLFVSFVNVPTDNLYYIMFTLCSLLIPINFLFTFIEVLFIYTTLADLVKKGVKGTS